MLPDRVRLVGEHPTRAVARSLRVRRPISSPYPRTPHVSADPHELAAWIAELRGRLARGEFADGGPIEVGGVSLPGVELAVRVVLADLDHYDDLTLEQRRDLLVVARRRLLLEDLRRLRAQIG